MTYLTGQRAEGSGVLRHSGASRALGYDREQSIHAAFSDRARAFPDAIAVVSGDESVTYSELDRLTDALAGFLIEQGIAKGDLVGLAVPRALTTVIAKLAILKAGGAYLPVDPAFPLEHLSYVLEECAPKVIFTDNANIARIRDIRGVGGSIIDLPALTKKLNARQSHGLPEVGGGDVAYVMYTSGSTGRPKGVAVTHRGVARLALDQKLSDTRPNDVVLHTATISFDAATFEIWTALLNGATLAVMPKASFTLSDICDVICEKGVTITLMTTGLFNLFVDCAMGQLPTLRHILFGGEAASIEHVRRYQGLFPGGRLTNAYGPTEASCIATVFRIPERFAGDELPIGEAISETKTFILDENLNPVDVGAEGQLALAGDALAKGYYNRPELTSARFVTVNTPDGPVRCYLTGDQAVLKGDGNLYFRGRKDRQVKINGKRIELDEIEAVLRRDPRLLDGVVACHEQNGSIRRLVAYLRPKNESDVDSADFVQTVMERLRNTLPPYMVPSTAVAMKTFPLTPAGKVDRSKLEPPPLGVAKLMAPESGTEEILSRLWQKALGAENVPLDRNFFDLGGTSLQLLKVHAGLEAELERAIDVFTLFKYTTIRELARFLDGDAAWRTRSPSFAERSARQRKNMALFRRSSTS